MHADEISPGATLGSSGIILHPPRVRHKSSETWHENQKALHQQHRATLVQRLMHPYLFEDENNFEDTTRRSRADNHDNIEVPMLAGRSNSSSFVRPEEVKHNGDGQIDVASGGNSTRKARSLSEVFFGKKSSSKKNTPRGSHNSTPHRSLTRKRESCTVCNHELSGVRLSPCNHEHSCHHCAAKLSHCPHCNEFIAYREMMIRP